jgi:hypothetical protein
MTTTTTTAKTTRTTSDARGGIGRAFGSLIAISCCACNPGPANAPPAEAPLRNGALADFIPAAGLRWMAAGRPAELANNPALKPLIAELLPTERLDAFASVTGVPLPDIPNALAAGFDLSTLYVAETPFENRMIETKFTDRLVAGAAVESKHPRVRRITGTVGLSPESLLRVDHRFVALAVGDPAQARIVELFVLGRLSRSPSALQGTALKGVPAEFAAAPLRFYAPGPFIGDWERGARGLLGGATAFGAMAVPEGDALQVKVAVVGSYEGTDVGRLSSAWQDLAESSLGRLTGLDQPISPPRTDLASGHLALEVKIALRPLFAGLRAAVAADVWEMLGGVPGKAPGPARKGRGR